MHIVLYSPLDWQIPDSLLDPARNQITRVKDGLPQMVNKIIQQSPDLVFVHGITQTNEYAVKLELLCNALPKAAVIPVCPNPEPEFLLRVMRAGVREVIPADEPALIAEVLARIKNRQQAAGGAGSVPLARRIAFMSAKGGDGGTCIAANIATALTKDPACRVLLIDLSLPFGDLEMYLTNEKMENDLADFCEEINRLDSSLLDFMVHHVSANLHLIAAPQVFDKVLKISAPQIERLIDLAARDYNYVLIDIGVGVDPISLQVLEKLDQLVVVSTMTVPSVRRVGQILRLWESLGYLIGKVSVVVNRFSGKSDVQISDFEKAIGQRVAKIFPQESLGVQESLLKGQPTIDLRPKAEFSRLIGEVAAEWQGKPIEEKSIWHRFGIK
jgi:pilus assembly protein CpaE